MLKIVNFIFPVLIIIMTALVIRILMTLPYEFKAKKSSIVPTVGKKQLPAVTVDDYDPTVDRVKRSLVNLKTRDDKYESIPEKIDDETWTTFDDFKNIFEKYEKCESWIESIIKIIEYCYGNPQENTKYVSIVNTRVRKLVDKLSTANFTIEEPLKKIKENINGMEHYALRLLAMYIYFGEDKSLKDKCRREILRFIPAVNKFINEDITELSDIFRLTVLRLLANYGHDNDKFKADFQDPKVQSAVDYSLDLQIEKNDNLGEYTLYDDDSYLAFNFAVDYTDLLVSASTFERALMGFQYPSTKYKRIEVILTKLLHPTIPYLPFGVFGFTGNRYNIINDLGWDVKGNLGVYIFPFIGLGVFKTEKFMFSLRVQGYGIPISPADNVKCAELSLGWLQMRKMYVNGYSYDRELTWDKLKNEPGVLTIDKEDYQHLLAEDVFGNGAVYECVNIYSFIGQLTKHKLMFWRDNYKFETFYGDCTIMEAGVVTNNGAQISYLIENYSGKLLKFRWKDDYSGFSEHKVTGASTEGNCVVVNPQSEGEDYVPTKFTLHMMIEGKEDYQVIIGNSEEKLLTFRYAGENYNVENFDEGFKLFKCSAKVDNLANPSYVIVGDSSSEVTKKITIEGVEYPRDKETLMYIIKSE